MDRFAAVGAGLLSLVALSGAADAADLPVKAPPLAAYAYDWSGLYVGLNGGGASSHECLNLASDNGQPITPPAPEGCHDATGGLFGGQLGYRLQLSHWVFGIEAQGDWAALKGSALNALARIPYINETKIDSLGLFTGQVGFAWNNVLVYLKGGAAVTHNQYSSYFPAGIPNIPPNIPPGFPFNQASETRWGGVIGTGLEYGFAPSWSVAAEYDHLFMGNNSVTFPASAVAVTRSDFIKQDVDMGTVRVSYRFGGPIFAKY